MSSSNAKSFLKYCLAYSSVQCKKILYLIAARMTLKNVGAFSLSCRQPFARHAILCHGHFRGVEEGENAKCLMTEHEHAVCSSRNTMCMQLTNRRQFSVVYTLIDHKMTSRNVQNSSGTTSRRRVVSLPSFGHFMASFYGL